jgi:predicted DNA-binding transcriptional regulator AlpA
VRAAAFVVEAPKAEDAVFLSAAQVKARYGGVSDMTRRLRGDQTFPKPIRFGDSKARYWRVAELELWENSQ